MLKLGRVVSSSDTVKKDLFTNIWLLLELTMTYQSKVTVKDREVKVNIFDMAGHPIFYEVRNEFYKDTQGAVMVYDVADRSSFEALDHLLLEMQNEIGNQTEHDNVVVCVCANKALFEGVDTAVENDGKKAPFRTQLGYTKDQIEAIQKLKNAKSDYERMGVQVGATKDEVNKAYRRLAVLLHPDKSVAPGSEEAFKILVAARTTLLKRCS
ncbi:DnaJ subfamily C member 27 [Mactra antiquata]